MWNSHPISNKLVLSPSVVEVFCLEALALPFVVVVLLFLLGLVFFVTWKSYCYHTMQAMVVPIVSNIVLLAALLAVLLALIYLLSHFI